MSSNPKGYRQPSAGFTKDELAVYATAGVRDRVQAIERELRRIQYAFPGLLINDAPIVLLAAEPRTDGKAWPLQAPDPQRSASVKTAWTPARRKQQAQWAKKQQAKLQAARRQKTTNSHPAVPIWKQIEAYLQQAPNQQATSKELLKATSAQSFASIASAFDYHKDVLKRLKQGVYTLTAAAKNGAEA